MSRRRRQSQHGNSPANTPPAPREPQPLNWKDRVRRWQKPYYIQCVLCGRMMPCGNSGVWDTTPMNSVRHRSKGKLWAGKPGVSTRTHGYRSKMTPDGHVCANVVDCRRARRAGMRYKPKDHSWEVELELHEELQEAIASKEVSDATFQRLVGWSTSELGLTDREVAREFSCALPTVQRWRQGINAPHPFMRPHVLKFFLDKALAALTKKAT